MKAVRRRLLAAGAAPARRWPHVVFPALDVLARATAGVGDRELTPARIAELMPHLSAAEAERAAWRSWSNRLRYATLKEVRRRYGLDSIVALGRDHERLRALAPPAVIASFHIGPLTAMGAALGSLDFPVGALAGRVLGDSAANVSLLVKGWTPEHGAEALLDAHRCLQRGEFVFVPLDGPLGARVEVPFLGASISLARGAFAVARRAEVPVVPVVARWEGTQIVTVVGEPSPVRTSEEDSAAEVAGWLERYLHEHPGELSRHLLDRMVARPRSA